MLSRKWFSIVAVLLISSIVVAPLLLVDSRAALAAPLATTWYVNGSTGDDGYDCLALATACRTVGGAVTKAASGDTIQIAEGIYAENLDVGKDLAFNGVGMDFTFLDGSQVGRVFVASSATISLANLTVQNGSASGSGTAGKGAGIFNDNGLMTLDSVRVTDNASRDGGGGIFTSGRLLVQNSEVINNTTQGTGGGVEVWSTGVLTVTQSLVGWNEASIGGGVFNTGAFLGEDSTLRENRSGLSGGGLANSGTGQVELVGVSVFENQTDGYGGGLANESGALSLLNVTVSGNSASNYVGVANINGSAQLTITNSTIAANIVNGTGTRYGGVANLDGTVSLLNTIVAGNDIRQCLASGAWTSLGYNLSSDSYCVFTQPGDEQAADPLLAPLADYGGPTWTHALSPGSPAIDTGTNTGCPAADQRGVVRPFDGDNDNFPVCDKGAFEARPQLVIDDVSLFEGDSGSTNAVFTVSLSPTSIQTVVVDYATTNGTAVAGSDYQATSGELIFDPGESMLQISVPVDGDTLDEADETFSVALSQPINADILDGEGVATIIDDDGLPSLTIGNVSVKEGDSGTVDAVFTVTLSPVHTQAVTVNYLAASGTATAGTDFTPASGMLTFDPGETTQTITVLVAGDTVDEGASETFGVLLSAAVNATLVDSIGGGTIRDDDIATLSIQNGGPVTEGNTGETLLAFTVALSLPASFTVTVDYYTQSSPGGAPATPGVDYAETTGTLSFSPGETSKTFTVVVYGDFDDEPDEDFMAFIINPDPVSIYNNVGTGYILDDDLIRMYVPFVRK